MCKDEGMICEGDGGIVEDLDAALLLLLRGGAHPAEHLHRVLVCGGEQQRSGLGRRRGGSSQGGPEQ